MVHRRWSRALGVVAAGGLLSGVVAGVAVAAPDAPLPATGATVAPTADGVAEIYPTVSGGQTWYLEGDPREDPRLDDTDDVASNGDGTWTMTDDRSRMSVRTTTFDWGDDDSVEDDQSVLADRGYMHDQNDWRDVEMTGYVRVPDDAGDDNIDWFARSYRHSDDNECWGTGYKSEFDYDGDRTAWKKELWHTGGYTDRVASKEGPGELFDRWVGLKHVMYNEGDAVHLELYMDYDNTNTWTKVNDYVDDGGWDSGEDNQCNGEDDQVITWGGPLATFRWDSAVDVEFTKLSIREIDPTGDGDPGDPPGDGCGDEVTPESVTDNGNDDNVAANVLDGDLDTRWSHEGFPGVLTADLGSTKTLCGAAVAWYKGDERSNEFTVSTSTDGSSFAARFSGSSDGRSLAMEHYAFDAPVQARYLRLTVTDNDDNQWASVTELRGLAG